MPWKEQKKSILKLAQSKNANTEGYHFQVENFSRSLHAFSILLALKYSGEEKKNEDENLFPSIYSSTNVNYVRRTFLLRMFSSHVYRKRFNALKFSLTHDQ